ncbi:MAG TPA: alanine racemase [Candidimonas sp.]|nr:alanine racemase [Candidimonas sp.]
MRPGANACRARPSDACLDGAYLSVDPTAITHNLHVLRAKLAGGHPGQPPRFWAVLKADAYGHGIEHVLPAIANADGVAVMTASEAQRCRRMGWAKPILVMSPDISDPQMTSPDLDPLHLVITCAEQVEQLERSAAGVKTGVVSRFAWLRFSGELHHAGVSANDYANAYLRLSTLAADGHLRGTGHLLHYASAEHAPALAQERMAFGRLIAGLPGQICTENSAALLLDGREAARTDWVRSGIALYGVSPLSGIDGAELGLRPAMTLQAPIIALQTLKAGDSVGYNGVYRTERARRIGLVRCGYADGYPRNLQDGCYVLAGGRPSKILGRVSMDTLAIDLDEHAGNGLGDYVTLWGTMALPVERVALWAGTIAAQLLTAATARVPRLRAGNG